MRQLGPSQAQPAFVPALCTALVVGYNWLPVGGASVKSCLVHVQPLGGQLGQRRILVVHWDEMCLQARLASVWGYVGLLDLCRPATAEQAVCAPWRCVLLGRSKRLKYFSLLLECNLSRVDDTVNTRQRTALLVGCTFPSAGADAPGKVHASQNWTWVLVVDCWSLIFELVSTELEQGLCASK